MLFRQAFQVDFFNSFPKLFSGEARRTLQEDFGLTAFGGGRRLWGFFFPFPLSFDYNILLSVSIGIKSLAATRRTTEPDLKPAKLESQGLKSRAGREHKRR